MAPVAASEGIRAADALVGRDPELHQLDQLLAVVESGGAALIIRVEAGVGKSALLQAASTRAQTVLSRPQRHVRPRPALLGSFGIASVEDHPSWAVVAVGDKAAGTDVMGSMAKRAGAKTVEIKGSHAIMVSQPQAVTDVILDALQAVAKPWQALGRENRL